MMLSTSSSIFSPIASSPFALESEPSAPTCSASFVSSSSPRLEKRMMGMSCVPYSFLSVRQMSVPLASGMWMSVRMRSGRQRCRVCSNSISVEVAMTS